MLFDARCPLLVSIRRGSHETCTQNASFMRAVTAFISIFFVIALCTSTANATETFSLKSKCNPGDTVQVKTVLELSGHLKIRSDAKKPAQLPITLTAQLLYDEKTLEADTTGGVNARSVRYYHQAGADIEVAGEKETPELGDDRHIVVAEATDKEVTCFSPQGALTREQLDLLEISSNSLIADRLLPEKEVGIGDTWPCEADVLTQLLHLEAVEKADVQCMLAEVVDGKAKLDLSGEVVGAAGGVETEIKLRGKAQFDMSKRRVTWLALVIDEDRGIGHAAPGFKVTARLRTLIAPTEKPFVLSDEAFNGLSLASGDGSTLVDFASAGGFHLTHDRRWQVTMDRQNVTILRLVDRGNLVAQCNVSTLPKLSAGKQVTMDAYQKDIHRALGDRFEQFVEATETPDSEGLRILRVVAVGVVSEVPIQWTYYLIGDAEGRQASVAFTIESKLVEQFARDDRSLISSFRFVEPEEGQPAKPKVTEGTRPVKR